MPAIAKTDREAILQAALKRVRRDGLAGFSLRALAGDVGITTNALYHYFPVRAHLEAPDGSLTTGTASTEKTAAQRAKTQRAKKR